MHRWRWNNLSLVSWVWFCLSLPHVQWSVPDVGFRTLSLSFYLFIYFILFLLLFFLICSHLVSPWTFRFTWIITLRRMPFSFFLSYCFFTPRFLSLKFLFLSLKISLLRPQRQFNMGVVASKIKTVSNNEQQKLTIVYWVWKQTELKINS